MSDVGLDGPLTKGTVSGRRVQSEVAPRCGWSGAFRLVDHVILIETNRRAGYRTASSVPAWSLLHEDEQDRPCSRQGVRIHEGMARGAVARKRTTAIEPASK